MDKRTSKRTLFENNELTPEQETVAVLIALGKKTNEICETRNLKPSTLYKWETYKAFKATVDKYKDIFIQKIIDNGFDDTQFLTRTMIESLKAPAKRSDGISARNLLARMRNEFDPKKKDEETKEELKKYSNSDLDKLLNDYPIAPSPKRERKESEQK